MKFGLANCYFAQSKIVYDAIYYSMPGAFYICANANHLNNPRAERVAEKKRNLFQEMALHQSLVGSTDIRIRKVLMDGSVKYVIVAQTLFSSS